MDHSQHHGADHHHSMEHEHHNPDTVAESNAGGHVHSMMMSMSFHGGTNETVLFDFWKFTTVGGLIGSIVVIFIMAVLYEGLKYYREYLFWKTYNTLQYRAVGGHTLNKDVVVEEQDTNIVQPSMWSSSHAYQTFLHGLQVSVSYLLMLIFMTYNTWLCLAVVAGAAMGNFLFGWRKHLIVDVTEHCH